MEALFLFRRALLFSVELEADMDLESYAKISR
jgi:hypothetical protein